VLLTTQYLDEADQLAADVVVIDHRRVIAAGTPAQLKTLAGDDVLEVHVGDADALAGAAAVPAALGRAPRVDPATQRTSVAVDGTHRLLEAVQALDHLGVAVGTSRCGAHPGRGVPHLTGHLDRRHRPGTRPRGRLTRRDPPWPTHPRSPFRPRARAGAGQRRGQVLAERGRGGTADRAQVRPHPQLLVLATVQSALFLVIFRDIFGSAVTVEGLPYVNFLRVAVRHHRAAGRQTPRRPRGSRCW
jgi:hypothetical protein